MKVQQMAMTVELSMYPFREDYRDAIKGFILKAIGFRGEGR